MKIVQFKDGTFGVRKFSIVGWCFLGLRPLTEGLWWHIPEHVSRYCHGTEAQARAAMFCAKHPPKREKPDTGRAIE